ncbi:hypothetical protein ROTO_32790 [Roseovarius tolerans]|uniref:ParB/Sulfiredoxin domain-containing protein n=1 Tax=Roseovarius tolerans TaxID=74031 RepID=A0A0L6CQY7_9RHOB|nr:hypothetical protein ROTO_32790 [Roseovarius tolerans]
MKFIDVPLTDLVVNPNNDRHGPKGDEQSAIDWLFSEHHGKMLSLAKDIVLQGSVFDPPLVKKNNGKFTVYDGNRRVTCLKALCGLCSLPDELQSQFSNLQRRFDCSSNMTISCQLEADQHTIDQIVSRRHNGTDGGRGQLGWDTRAKQNHAKRIGVTTQYPIAEAVEEFLADHGYPYARQIKRSTIYRLINAKRRQRQFGIELEADGKLKLLRDEDDILAALSKVADDILEKNLTLKNVLNSEGVDKYMGNLEQAGLIEPANTNEQGNSAKEKEGRDGRSIRPKRKPERENLIPKKHYDFEWPHGLHKVEMIWQELQFTLRFDRHAISIPILFRTLIELLTDYAASKIDQPSKQQDKLSSRVKKVASYFCSVELMTIKERDDLERLLGYTKSPRELEVLNRCVHSKTTLPAKEDLAALWTEFEQYLLLCIEVKRQ